MAASFDPIQPILIKTKLSPPQRRTELVSRPCLRDLLMEGSAKALTLICAPPGYGKTTLLTEWMASLAGMADAVRPAICWLSLDAEDNDPVQFFRYLVSTFEKTNTLPVGDARAILETFPPQPSQTILRTLINSLERLNRPVCLVLDDYQFITNPDIQKALAYFLDRLPANLHIIIAARSDPPLPLARLRARNQLVEIRAEDLRFTPEEAAAFLIQVMNLPLSPADILTLETRTEGWIAGLQMAAVAMRELARQRDASTLASTPEGLAYTQFIQRFSGSHRYILDYLAEETLNRLPEDVQHFLAWTSPLERFCAPLCDAVLASPTISARDMLAYLDKANLFLIAMDADQGGGDERWFRYHHLFSDLLRARLKESQPDQIPTLHLRAADWFEQNGAIVEAVQHTLLAKAYDRSGDLLLKYGPARWSQSDTRVMLLAKSLPFETLVDHPKIGIYQAWILIASGQTAAALPLLHALREHVENADAGPTTDWMAALTNLLLAYAVHPAPATHHLPLPDIQALDAMPAEDTGLHNIGDFLHAMLLARRGIIDDPAEILVRCLKRDEAAGGTTAIPLTVPFLARARLLQTRLHEGASLCREYLKSVNRRGTKVFYNAGALNIVLGEILREWNELEEAEAQIREGIKVNEPWHNIASDALGYAALVRVQEARGDLAGVHDTLQKLETLFEDRTRPPDWEGELRSLTVRMWLASGELARAVEWARQYPIQPSMDPLQETDHLTAARVRMAEKNYPEVLRILEALNQTPGIEKRVTRKIKILLLTACAFQGMNQTQRALELLENGLALAEPEGLIRIFLDNGEPMKDLLKRYLGTSAPSHQAYAQKLLDQFPAELYQPAPGKPQHGLAEPLTPREREILTHMADGLSNRQIAENLFLSEGTVKFHVHSILEKLDVHSRTAALARARALGIIDG